jgi:hypothetical protein
LCAPLRQGVSRQTIDRRTSCTNVDPDPDGGGDFLRFSLAALPIVEYFFVWPGIGAGL